MIIPRSPSPVSLEERDVDTLSPEEMRQLFRRQRQRELAAKTVKRERSRERSRSATAVDENDSGSVFRLSEAP
jgi:hypothetical protein